MSSRTPEGGCPPALPNPNFPLKREMSSDSKRRLSWAFSSTLNCMLIFHDSVCQGDWGAGQQFPQETLEEPASLKIQRRHREVALQTLQRAFCSPRGDLYPGWPEWAGRRPSLDRQSACTHEQAAAGFSELLHDASEASAGCDWGWGVCPPLKADSDVGR